MQWEGALEITFLEVPKNSKVEHSTVAIHLVGGKEQAAKGLA